MNGSGPIARLIDEFARLPGIGPKTAQRLAFYILNEPPETARSLARVLVEASEKIRRCSQCYDLTDRDPCIICQDPKRNNQILCVVEQPRDVIAMEKSKGFKGLYHVLHGHKFKPYLFLNRCGFFYSSFIQGLLTG